MLLYLKSKIFRKKYDRYFGSVSVSVTILLGIVSEISKPTEIFRIFQFNWSNINYD